ncbi:MAG: gluconate 5-dehydrogenase [Phycisphaerae bacterium]
MSTRGLQDTFGLKGQTALITGGGSGLGLAMAGCLARAGARVVLVGRRAELLASAQERIGPAALSIPWDITRLDTLPDLVAQAEKRAGPLTILINNAGNYLKKPAMQTTDHDWSAVLQTHLTAAFSLAREAARNMIDLGQGSILFIGSMAAVMGVPSVSAYTAAKAAVTGLTRQLAAEWSPHGIRVNAIVPGWISTAMTATALDSDPPRKAKILSRTPMGRLGEPDDVGWAAVYLCSPAAKFVTGTTLTVDGGAAVGF